MLEQLIDNTIADMKTVVAFARDEMFQHILNDKDGSDLALGMAFLEINTAFIAGFKLRNNRNLTSDERSEMLKILQTRLGEIREAIFKCG